MANRVVLCYCGEEAPEHTWGNTTILRLDKRGIVYQEHGTFCDECPQKLLDNQKKTRVKKEPEGESPVGDGDTE